MPLPPEVTLARWTAALGADDELSRLLAAYHLQTEAEKGAAVPGVEDLPERYRAEIQDPGTAFDRCAVFLASCPGAVGCVVVTPAHDGRVEIKRVWTDPDSRGRGIAAALVTATVDHATDAGARVVQLSVWNWRTGAIRLYERLGFTTTGSWDPRDQLLCLERLL